MSRDVVQAMTAEVLVQDASDIPIETTFTYDKSDPWAVTAVFKDPRGGARAQERRWVFARELLSSGLHGKAGRGDVQIWSDDATAVMIRLTTQEGEAVMRCPAIQVRRFLLATARVVPEGDEDLFMDLDGSIARLLAAS